MNQTEHIMQTQPTDSTFASTVTVAGKSNYGEPIYKSLINNQWLQNITQEYVVSSFTYSTSNNAGNLLYNTVLNPVFLTNNMMPWFIWFVSNYQGFKCDFDLVLEPIMHSAHRGILAVAVTLDMPSSVNSDSGFLPIENFDISGASDQEYVYALPNVYAFNGKMYFEDARDLGTPISSTSRVPIMATRLGYLQIRAVTPLASSSMLPNTITVLIKLRPKIQNLTVFAPIIPSAERLATVGRLAPEWLND